MFQPPYPFVKPHRYLNSLTLHVTLRGAPSRRRRRVFFARLYAEARRLGLVSSQKLGFCVFFGAERLCGTAHRQQLVYWLIDQPEVAEIDVGQLAHLGDLFQARARRAVATETPFPEPLNDSRTLAHRVAMGVVAQWIQYLNGVIA